MHLLRIVIALASAWAFLSISQPFMGYLTDLSENLENLQVIQVTDGIGVYMRVALLSGVTIMFPYIAFELWLFAAPGLRARERKMGLLGYPICARSSFTGMASQLFAFATCPAIAWETSHRSPKSWTASDYFGFVTGSHALDWTVL